MTKINEIAEQAGLHLTGRVVHCTAESLEKFAELIVRECVAICQDIDGEEDAMAKCGRQDCAVEIKQHFGVEE